jgi:hypothetical protein
VGVFPLLHGRATLLDGVQQLAGEAVRHALLATLARRLDDPAHGQRLAALGAHFHRNLVGCATDPAGLDLYHRADVVQGLFNQIHRIRALVLFADSLDGAVHDLLGHRLLAADHDHVDETGNHFAAELGVRQDIPGKI